MARDRWTRRAGALLPATARAAIAPRVAKARAFATSLTARLLACGLQVFPRRVLGRLKEELVVTIGLDSPGGTVQLAVDSELEVTTRSISCRKEPETLDWAQNIVRPGDIVYDVGANVGAYSLLIDEVHHGACTIYAFEPAFSNFAQLNKNVFLNGCAGRVVPVQIALSDSTGFGQFRYSRLGPGSALHGLDDAGGLSQPVPTVRMDDLQDIFGAPQPSHIKLDVDGAEYAILLGSARTLTDGRLRSVLVEMEAHRRGADRIAELLEATGFRLASEHHHGVGGEGPRNCIFVRRNQ